MGSREVEDRIAWPQGGDNPDAPCVEERSIPSGVMTGCAEAWKKGLASQTGKEDQLES